MMVTSHSNFRKFVDSKQKLLAFAAVLTCLGVTLLGNIGIYKFINFELGLIIIVTVSTLSFCLMVTSSLSKVQIFVLITFSLLFIHTLATSKHLGFSVVLVFHAMTAAVIFVALQQNKFACLNSPNISNAITGAKCAFIFFAILHAITLIFFYLFQPDRTTGLLDDFSQASMFLLLALGFAYPLWKDKIYFSGFALLIFLAYFTSYSRTANFLLVLFLAVLFLIEHRNKAYGAVIKLCVLALIAIIAVKIYPEFVDKETISRGLSHLSTLNSRTIYWETAWDAILQKPWFGWGLRTYAWTGIQETQPFNIIYFVHNDYLQIWHDLGIFWLLLFVGVYAFILMKHSPLKVKLNGGVSFYYKDPHLTQVVAWLGMVLIALYMCINFLIASLEFQIAIAILLADLLDDE